MKNLLFLSCLTILPIMGYSYEFESPEGQHWLDEWLLGKEYTEILYKDADDLDSLLTISENVKISRQKHLLSERPTYILLCDEHFYEIGKLKHCSICPCRTE